MGWVRVDEGAVLAIAAVSAVRRALPMMLSWICVELCPGYGKCATHVGAAQQKEVRRRSRERANGIERAERVRFGERERVQQ